MRYIVWGDAHFSQDKPLCRLDDDWMGFQEKVLQSIVDIAYEKNAVLICTGDLLDTPRVSPALICMIARVLRSKPIQFYFIAGNHSILYHKQENLYEGSLGILASFSEFGYLPCADNSEQGRFEHAVEMNDVTIIHTLTFPTMQDIPFGAKAISAYQLLEKYKTRYLFLGDNHHKFVIEDEGRYVINPGCSMITTASMIGYEPSVYYVDTEKSITQEILVYQNADAVTRSHLDNKQERRNRYAALIESIPHTGGEGLSFLHNLEQKISTMNLMSESLDILEELRRG